MQTRGDVLNNTHNTLTPSIIKVWGRVIRGLEWIAAAEVSLVPSVSSIQVSHREVSFNASRATFFQERQRMSCFDDLFFSWGESGTIRNTKASLEDLPAIVAALSDLPQLPKNFTHMRVTASILGETKKFHYSRRDVEDRIGILLQDKTGLNYVKHEDVLHSDPLWVRVHFTRENSMFGLRMDNVPLHRRSWRSKTVVGALHPPVAAAMCMLADIRENDIVLDPFLGSGTILLEAGHKIPNLKLVGIDVDQNNVNIAKQNFAGTGLTPDLIISDANTTMFPKVDRIITNPPWGNLVDMKTPLNIANIMAALKENGRAVFIVDQSLNFRDRLLKEGYNPLFSQTLRVAGRLAEIIIVDNTGKVFRNTPVGRTLAKAWKKYDTSF
jgi:23S rRNA G2445 N2-methylase RlmL